MIASGVSFRRSVSPGWPFCPPGFLPDGSRKLLTRGGFLSPSLDGGLPLLLLFSPRRRSNSAICARNAAISAACPACCASSSAMRSSFESWSRAVRSTDSFESTRRSHVNRILHPCPASRHNTRTPACDRVSWTVGLGTWAVTHDLHTGLRATRIEGLGTRIIGIGVKTDGLRLSRLVDDLEGLRRLAEIILAGALVMRNRQGHRCRAPDHQRFVDRFFKPFEIVSMVRAVKSAIWLDGFDERQNLLCRSGDRARIIKAGTEADGPLFHRLADLAPHFGHLCGGSGAVEAVHHPVPQ